MADVDAETSFDSAVTQLCSAAWAPTGVHVGTEQTDIVLHALLPSTRHSEGRVALGASPGAVANLVSVLRDPLVFHERPGLLTIRILRNLCVRQPGNQSRAAEAGAHFVVLDAINDAIIASKDDLATRSQPTRLCTPFYGFAVEFLVNFVTGNPYNANLVWDHAFPRTLHALLISDNNAAAAAAAALVHNCVVAAEDLLPQVLSLFTDKNEDTSLLNALISTVLLNESGTVADGSDDEKFLWSLGLIRRLAKAGFLRDSLNALGPSIDMLQAEPSSMLSKSQRTLLHIIDAGAGKAAEGAYDDGDYFAVPSHALPFFTTLLQTMRAKGDSVSLRVAGSIVGSVVILCDNSALLDELCVNAVICAVDVLQTLAARDAAGDGAAAAMAAIGNGTKDTIKLVSGKKASGTALVEEVQGLKGTMVRLIAVCCDECNDAQEAVRKEGGIPFILNALAYERDVSVNPFLREWAVLAVRNLTHGNEENVREINSFEMLGLLQHNEVLDRAGLEAFMDEKGRPRVRQKSKV